MGQFRVKLKELYKKHNVTQGKVAKDLNVYSTSLSAFALDQRSAYNKVLMLKLMDYFKLEKLDDLIEYIPDETNNEKDGSDENLYNQER